MSWFTAVSSRLGAQIYDDIWFRESFAIPTVAAATSSNNDDYSEMERREKSYWENNGALFVNNNFSSP